jgi:hypothetical protein
MCGKYYLSVDVPGPTDDLEDKQIQFATHTLTTF